MNPLHTLLATALAAAALIAPMRAESANECYSTSQSMQHACMAEGTDDFWVDRAICLNDTSTTFAGCLAGAGTALRDLWSDCNEQRDARNDLCRSLPTSGPYDPQIDPDDFLTPQQASDAPNPFFPLVIGRNYTYEAEGETVVVTVTDDTREILGVETTAVRDTVVDDEGNLVEDTIDWFAQDREGNVWYFGEIVQNFEDGVLVDVDGSFTAGVDGAKPGIIMPAAPRTGFVYRQEFALGDAEDAAEVLRLDGDESVPAADCDHGCLVTRDFNPLSPGHDENKYYARGVGLVLEIDPRDGSRLELVDVEDE